MSNNLLPESKVEIAKASLYNMIRSVIETFPREATGDLFGFHEQDSLIVTNAYPLITSKRAPTTVGYGNKNARVRLRKLEGALANGNGHTIRIGGYHSHIGREMSCELTKLDTDFISEEFEDSRFQDKSWLEVLLHIRREKYQRPIDPKVIFRQYAKKLYILVRDEPYQGYAITLATFKVRKDGHVQEHPLRLRTFMRRQTNLK